MAKGLDIEALGQKAAERAIDEIRFSGHTLREWVRILARVEKAFVPSGEWVYEGQYNMAYEYRCSNCDMPQTFYANIPHYRFCPICGAKMMKENEHG